MSIRNVFQQAREKSDMIVAKTVVEMSLTQAPASTTMGEFLDEIKSRGSHFEKAFRDVTFGELRQNSASSTSDLNKVPGPSRKREVTSNMIVNFVTDNPGLPRGEIMRALGLKGGTISSQLRKLHTQGRLRPVGPNRNYLYFPVN